jgi:hypothetical protein
MDNVLPQRWQRSWLGNAATDQQGWRLDGSGA